MTRPHPKNIVIFDFSGTLSLKAPRFAQTGNLLRALEQSGLCTLGVATVETFWRDIVGPTWAVGSTTAIGYKAMIARRIETLGLVPGRSGGAIADAASRFVDLYLAHSTIDPSWRPTLSRLCENDDVCLLVATDHYAEATATVAASLRLWDIPARKCGAGGDPARRNPFRSCLIANSADIGFWKSDRRFWETVRAQLPPLTPRSVQIIDDFGFNEEAADRWSEPPGVEERVRQTTEAIESVFDAPLSVVPFCLDREARERPREALRMIEATIRKIDRHLLSANGNENGR